MIAALASFAGRRPIAVVMMAVVVSVLGLYSVRDLSIDLFPDVQSPTVLVSVSAGDTPTEQMERLYGERIERMLFAVPGLSGIDQTVRNGKLISKVHFDWETDVDLALVDVNRAVASIASDPDVDELKIRRFDTKQIPIVVMGLTIKSGDNTQGGQDLAEFRRLAERQLARNIEQLEGVAEVRVSGGRVRQVQVQLNLTAMVAYGITLSEVNARISASNVDFNAGTLEDQDKVLLVRGKSRFVSVSDIENVVIRYIENDSGLMQPIKVSDIAKVVTDNAEFSSVVRVDGQEGVGLFVYKEAGSNTVAVSKNLKQAIAQLNRELAGLKLTMISDEAALVEDAISDVEQAAIFGIVLAIAVLALFLRSLGPIFIVAVAVPVSLLTTTFLMALAEQSLNLMTMAGLALGAGMLVDNAIVVIESIFRRRSLGDSPLQAAKNGTSVVGGAIIASTLTTCIVFLPVLFIEGMAAKLVSGISFTVVVSLCASLFVAIFLIPSLSISLLPKGKVKHIDPGSKRVENMVMALLARPYTILLLSVTLVAAAIYGLKALGTEFLPPQDPRQFTLKLTAPAGQQVEATQINVANVEAIIRKSAGDDLQAILAEVGKIEEDHRSIREQHSAENMAELRVRLAAGGSTATTVVQSATPAIEQLYGTEVDWQLGASTFTQAFGTQGSGIVVELTSDTLPALRESAELLQKQLQQRPELWNVTTSFEGAPEEIHLRVNRALAQSLGIDLDMVSAVVAAALDGHKVTTLILGDESQDVVLTLPKVDSREILSLKFNSADGRLFSVGDVAEVSFTPGDKEIFRRNQRRIAHVSALVSPDVSNPQARAAVQQVLRQSQLPLGVWASLAGDESLRAKTFDELGWAALLALLLVLMILSASFESLLLPMAVLASIPIALIGVAVVLLAIGQPIGVMALLGFVVLVGVAVNDAILFAQTARDMQHQGVALKEAIAKSVSIRLRPIIMTTATTVLSLLPLALGSGEGAQLRSPLAWTVVGGITASTLGCLFVIPCLYYVLGKPFERKAQLYKGRHEPA